MSDIALQPAQPADIPLILAQLRSLGISDGVPHMATTAEHLHQALFAEQPAAYCQLVMFAKAVAGMVIYSWKWAPFTGRSELYLHAIHIDETYRRRGLARAAMAQLARMALARGCSRMEWLVVRGNPMSQGFYDACRASLIDRMALRRLVEPALSALASEARQGYEKVAT